MSRLILFSRPPIYYWCNGASYLNAALPVTSISALRELRGGPTAASSYWVCIGRESVNGWMNDWVGSWTLGSLFICVISSHIRATMFEGAEFPLENYQTLRCYYMKKGLISVLLQAPLVIESLNLGLFHSMNQVILLCRSVSEICWSFQSPTRSYHAAYKEKSWIFIISTTHLSWTPTMILALECQYDIKTASLKH